MSVTIMVDDTTDQRELAAIACLIAVLRGSDDLPAPPRVLFDYSDNPLAERPAPPAPPAAAEPTPAPASSVPPPPTEPPASEALIQREAARADAAPAGETDVNGLPYDDRIHSGTKAKNNDGSWRNKRGVDPALLASVTAELKAKAGAAAPPPPAEAGAPPPPSEAASDPAADAATAFGAGGADGASDPPANAGAPPPPAADGAAPPPPAEGGTPPAGELTYPQIIARANDAGLDYDTLNGLSVELGLDKFSSLTKRPDLFRLFADMMETKIAEGPATPAA